MPCKVLKYSRLPGPYRKALRPSNAGQIFRANSQPSLVQGLKPRYELHHGVRISDRAVVSRRRFPEQPRGGVHKGVKSTKLERIIRVNVWLNRELLNPDASSRGCEGR